MNKNNYLFSILILFILFYFFIKSVLSYFINTNQRPNIFLGTILIIISIYFFYYTYNKIKSN